MNTLKNNFRKLPQNQHGAALFMALMFLIIITMLSLSAMRSSVMELRMATNSESEINATQRAQAVIDATVADPNNTPVVGAVGETTCLVSSSKSCTRKTIVLKDSAKFQPDLEAGYIDVEVTRVAPLLKPAPRVQGYSLPGYSVATFEVDGTFDAAQDGEGSAEIVEGLLVLIAN